MVKDQETAGKAEPDQSPTRDLPEAAKRALKEAEERRRQRDETLSPRQTEINGRDGPDPVRYGDWEVGGLTSDF